MIVIVVLLFFMAGCIVGGGIGSMDRTFQLRWPWHHQVRESTCDPFHFHPYGAWSKPYGAMGLQGEMEQWVERRCKLPRCHAGEWKRVELPASTTSL